MKAFVVFAAVLAAASANPQLLLNNNLGYLGYPTTYSVNPLLSHQIVAPLATQTQYHLQDNLGRASYGYAHPGQAAQEVRDLNGNVRGSYSYVNPNGKQVQVQYTAGEQGFRVISNDLPVAPVHHAQVANLVAPNPVQDTAEVRQAKAEHFQAHQEALARSGRKKRQIYTTSAVIPATNLGYQNVIAHQPINNIALSNVHGYANINGVNTLVSNVNGLNTLGYSNINGLNTLGYSTINGLNTLGYSNVQTALTTPLLNQAVTYSAPVVSHETREATLTKIANNPGHAYSYRID